MAAREIFNFQPDIGSLRHSPFFIFLYHCNTRSRHASSLLHRAPELDYALDFAGLG